MGYRVAWLALALLVVMTLFVVGYCVSQPTTVERVRDPGQGLLQDP
jgi:hypothetical protein